ncbi:MAG: hypothetical protein IKI59_04680, partial [Clostridia bacterium]|nr:hypothetical protein [Clostridia bacterium]
MKRLGLLLLAALLLLTPAAVFADSNINKNCTIEIHADNPVMKYLTDNTYSTTVTFNAGDWFRVQWTEKNPVAALYWEWRYIPQKALVEQLNDAGEVVASREYANVIRFLTVFPEEGVSEIRMTVL